MSKMKFILNLITYSIIFFHTSYSQNYTLESIIGGVGQKGQKITTTSRKYQLKGSSIYFLETKVGKTIIEVDKDGIIKNKFIFPFFSKATDNKALNNISEFYVDTQDRILAYEDSDRIIYCFNKTGEKIYETKNINTFSQNTYEVCFVSDSKNNLYVGGANSISVLDKNGVFLFNIGKKGTADGEFNGQIDQLFVDQQDNIYALSQKVIQVFDATGKYLSKFNIAYSEKMAFDGEFFYASASNYRTFEKLDRTGIVKSKLEIGNFDNRIYDVVGYIEGDLIISVNKYSGSEYTAFDSIGKPLRKLNLDPYTEGIDNLTDFIFDRDGNLWIGDWYKIQYFDSKSGNWSNIFENGPLEFSDINQMLRINDKKEMLFHNNSDYSLSSIYLDAQQNTLTTINTLDKTNRSNYIEIDSLKKEVIFLVSPFSGDSYINVYDFGGNFLRKYATYREILAIAKNRSNQYYLITQEGFDYKFTIKVLNNDGVEIASYKTDIGDFAQPVIGATFDENDILHIGIRDVYNGKGFTIYAFDTKGKLLKEFSNLADNGGNFVRNSSFLLKYHSGHLYFGDYINNQIIKLKFSLENLLLRPNIQINDVTKNINNPDFYLTPASSSKAPFEYELYSGGTVSVTSDGKVKILKVGISQILIRQKPFEGYDSEEIIMEINIKLASPLIQPISAITKSVNDESFKISPSSNSSGNFEFKIKSGEAISIDNTGLVKILKGGKTVIEITQLATDQFTEAKILVDVEIKKLNQILNFDKLAAEIFNNVKTVPLKAVSSSGLPVIFRVISGPATIQNNALILNGTVGTVVVQALQEGSDKYNSVSENQSVKVKLVLSLENAVNESVKVYPNPVIDKIEIETQTVFDKYIISDLNGKTIMQGDLKKVLDTEFLPFGTYLLQLEGKSKSQTLKFIKR